MTLRFLGLFLVLMIGGLPRSMAEETPLATNDVQLVVWNRYLADFRSPIGLASVDERLTRAKKRFADLPDSALTEKIEVRPATVGKFSGVMIHAGDHFLFAIAEQDLDVSSGETMDEVTKQAIARVQELVAARAASRHQDVILHGAWVSALSLIGLGILLVVLWRTRRRVERTITARHFERLPPLFGLDLRESALDFSHVVIRLPFMVGGFIATYACMVLVLSSFPYTNPWSQTLGTWLWSVLMMITQGIVGSLPGLFIVLIIVLMTRFASRSLTKFCSKVEAGQLQISWMQPEIAQATSRIASVMLWLFAITVSYPYLPGSSSDAFKGVSVFAGLVLTLGSSGVVNQVMSGLVVVYARSMRQGDLVQVNDTVGTVVELGLLSTKVRTARQEEVNIPNAVLVGTLVTNFSRHDADGMAIHANVTIGYDTPWRQVHAMLNLAAQRTSGIRATPEPFVVQKALDDFYVAYELRARMEKPEQHFLVLSALHANIQDVFNEYGVQIMSPHFEGQPSQNVVVPKAQWAPAPAGAV